MASVLLQQLCAGIMKVWSTEDDRWMLWLKGWSFYYSSSTGNFVAIIGIISIATAFIDGRLLLCCLLPMLAQSVNDALGLTPLLI